MFPCVPRAQTAPADAPHRSSTLPEEPQASSAASDAVVNGTVSGMVTDVDGALIPGAEVSLLDRDQAPLTAVQTDSAGRFVLSALLPGTFTLRVEAAGLLPANLAIELTPGESFETDPIVLLAGTSVSVTVLANGHDAAEVEVKKEETQRLLGVLPNFYVSYDFHAPALDARQKWELNWRTIADPVNLVLVAGQAGVEQATNAYSGFRQGASGYGKRFGAGFADLAIGNSLGGWVFPVLFRQDPRYFYMGSEHGTRRRRFFYALSTAVIARGDNGKWQPAYASLLGDLSAGAASNLYYPAANRQGASLTFQNGLLDVALDGVNNVIQEFVLKHVTPGTKKP